MKRHRIMLAGLSAAALLPGCTTVVTFNILAPGLAGSQIGMYAAASQKQGPRVTFVNDSAVALKVRYWVGRRDTTAPGGVADIRTDDHLAFTASPGEFAITQVGRPWLLTSMADSVVRVRIEPADESRGPVWMNLQQPGPFKFNATGDSFDTLAFNRFGGGDLSPLPREEWFDGNNGPFPVRTDLAAR